MRKKKYYNMNNLYIINETFTNGYRTEILDLLWLISVLNGIFVIISKNPVISVLFLIGLFLSIALYLIILGISFIGLSYLLVYVGAVSILFLFILMLINVRISELYTNTSNSMPLAFIIAVCFNYPLLQILPYNLSIFNNYNNLNNTIKYFWYNHNYTDFFKNFSSSIKENTDICFVTTNVWDGNIAETSHITSIGNIMYTSYSLWLIITSLILLLAMVGAIVITIKQKL